MRMLIKVTWLKKLLSIRIKKKRNVNVDFMVTSTDPEKRQEMAEIWFAACFAMATGFYQSDGVVLLCIAW